MAIKTEIYRFNDYREALQRRLMILKKSVSDEFNGGNMAEHCRVQSAYLSRVFHGRAHLNSDQIYRAIQYLKLDEQESQYILALHEYQRSDLPERKKSLKKILDEFQKKASQPESHIERKIVADQSDRFTIYFTDPQVQVVFFFLNLKRYRQNFPEIASALNVPLQRVEEIVQRLMELKLVTLEDGQLKVKPPKEVPYLKKESELFDTYHAMAKANGHQRLVGLPKDRRNCASLYLTCDKATIKEIRERILNLLVEFHELASKTKEATEMYQFSFDLFPWSE